MAEEVPLAELGAERSQLEQLIGPPIAVLPRKIVVYSAITRPRMSALVNRCSVEFAVIANSIDA